MKITKSLKLALERLFTKRPSLKGTEETHWVYHIYDETCADGQTGGWFNIHGFEEGPGQIYWLGIDCRVIFGIRVQDILIKFKSKELYEEYRQKAWKNAHDVHRDMMNDPRLNFRWGSDINTEYVFRWSDESKSFNLWGNDKYSEEK